MKNSKQKTELKPKQKKCIELMILGTMTQKEIAEKLNVTEATICNWKKKSEFDDEYVASLKECIKGVAARAFSVETELLGARSETVRLMTAKDILDRAGFKSESNVNVNASLPIILEGEDKLEE